MAKDENSLCRVCLKQDKMLISVFDLEDGSNHSERITFCTGVVILECDGYPTVICSSCKSDLSVAYDFITRCKDSDKSLRESEMVLAKVKKEDFEEDNGDNDFPPDDLKFDVDEIKEEDIIKQDKEVDIRVHKKKKVKRKKGYKISETKCSICGLRTSGHSALITHMRRHTGERPFKCPQCDMRFAQTGTLKLHINRRHSTEPRHLRERKFSCESCGVRFFSKRDLVVHSRRHTGDHPYVCQLCNQSFTQIGSLIRHRRIHTGERPYSCKTCGKCFADGSSLKSHQAVHSEERKHTCNICGKSLKAKTALKKHIELHTNAKSLICDQCGIGFSTKGNLTLHIKKVHSERSGNCKECGKHCPDIAEHMRKHTGEAIYACVFCEKRYPTKRSLSIHMNKHTNADKHKCDKENCSKTFPRKFQLDFHLLKYHSNETPFTCKVCHKGYLRLSDLKKHLRVYHPNYVQVS